MFDELRRLAREAAADDSVLVLVLTGEGRSFCAGPDLAEAESLAGMSAPEFLAGQEGWADAVAGFRRLPKPCPPPTTGLCRAGLGLALAADIRVAATTAKFNAAFVRIGLSGGDVGVSRMRPRIVGLGRAAEII